MNGWSALALLLALAAALALRIPRLNSRPLHNDEAVNAVKVSELWLHGRYAYDPDEYHGPTLHYATLPFLWLSGPRDSSQLEDSTLRLAPVFFGVGLILLLLLFADGLGYPSIGWAALFTAVSPAMVFYSRYFIHEMPLVFFTALTLGAGWRYRQTRRSHWAIVAGTGIGLMFATKETFVITLAAMGLAGFATTLWSRGQLLRMARAKLETVLGPSRNVSPAPHFARPDGTFPWRHAGLALLAAVVVWLLFFTSFGTHGSGPADSLRTYLPWMKRAGGHSPHIHPWSFYLERLLWFHPVKGPAWSEGLILALAGVGASVSILGRRSRLHCFLAFYTVILTGAYCLISYKTPWCLLSFLHGLILLAGVGATTLIEFFRRRTARFFILATLVGLTSQLAWQAWRASFVYPADRRNPYAYAQTVPDLLKLVQKAEALARVAPAGHEIPVKVIALGHDYWPLPWYLRRFKNLGWFEQLPANPYAPIVIVSSNLDARLDEKSDRKWVMTGLSELRPGNFLELYVELELWKKYVETLPRERD